MSRSRCSFSHVYDEEFTEAVDLLSAGKVSPGRRSPPRSVLRTWCVAGWMIEFEQGQASEILVSPETDRIRYLE